MKFKAYLIYMMVIILIAAFPQMIDILASQEIKMQVLYQELQILSDSNQISPIPNFHGFCYGTFRGLGPATGEQAKAEYVQEDLEILKRLNVTDIRTYGSGLNQHIIPQIAYDIGINCATGVWLDYNKVNNEIELQLGLSVANVSSMLIIGNEVLLRHDLTETELLEYISDAKNQSSDLIPITTAETYDIWLDHPNLADACDVLLVHVYPFWEGIQIAYAASYTIEKLNLVQQAYPNKTIYLAEAGWPSSGRVDCSERYQNLFYEDLLPLVAQNQIKAYFFEAFDEAWKTEEGVGPHWGIFNKNRTPKESAMIFEEYFGGEVLFPPTCN
ncbi:MAG: glycosyl hydrolase family 17 protein, partial [Candidatus Hodarchaeota archaeon]